MIGLLLSLTTIAWLITLQEWTILLWAVGLSIAGFLLLSFIIVPIMALVSGVSAMLNLINERLSQIATPVIVSLAMGAIAGGWSAGFFGLFESLASTPDSFAPAMLTAYGTSLTPWGIAAKKQENDADHEMGKDILLWVGIGQTINLIHILTGGHPTLTHIGVTVMACVVIGFTITGIRNRGTKQVHS
jgi:hypothetical protein